MTHGLPLIVVQSQSMHVPLTPIRCLYRATDLYGRKTGLVCGASRFTYAEFGERCERLAHGLISEGVRPGDRVAFLSFNTHQLPRRLLRRKPLAGAIVMPLNVRLTPHELAAILQHAEPRILIYESDFAPLVEQLRNACPGVHRFIETGEPYEELLPCAAASNARTFPSTKTPSASSSYTSGSTGTPKGVMLSHRTIYLHAFAVMAQFCHDDKAVELHTIPLFHANGWGRPHASTWIGSRQVMVRRFEPSHVFRSSSRMSMLPACRWFPLWPTLC